MAAKRMAPIVMKILAMDLVDHQLGVAIHAPQVIGPEARDPRREQFTPQRIGDPDVAVLREPRVEGDTVGED